MSTDPIADPAPKSLSYTITRGGLYLLEGLCQLPEPWKDSLQLQRRANSIWMKLHRLNPPRTEQYNFEKGLLKEVDEKPEAYAARARTFDEASAHWGDDVATLELSPKHQASLLKGLAWGFKNREKWALQNNQHVASILDAFGDLLDIEPD